MAQSGPNEYDVRIFQGSDNKKLQTEIAIYLDAHSAAGWEPCRINEISTATGLTVIVYVIRPLGENAVEIPQS